MHLKVFRIIGTLKAQTKSFEQIYLNFTGVFIWFSLCL